MKFIHPLIALLACSISSSLLAATLEIPMEVRLLTIDGQKAAGKIFNKAQTIPITEGLHQIVVKVEKTVRSGSHDQEAYKSKPIIVNFNSASSEQLSLALPPLSNKNEAARFDENPHIIILNHNQQPIKTTQDVLKLEGLVILANYENELAKYNLSQRPASIPTLAKRTVIEPSYNHVSDPQFATNPTQPITVTTTPITSQYSVTVQGQTAEEEMLQYWYQRADKQSRQRFLEWVNKQK